MASRNYNDGAVAEKEHLRYL